MKVWDIFKSGLFKCDAEEIHNFSVKAVQSLGNLNPKLLEALSGASLRSDNSILFAGKNLLSPVGLAAGFDKNAVLVPYLPHLGFGFAEIGSVTLRSQEGNSKPRLARGDDELFNRMGFNNDGAEKVAQRLSTYKVPSDFALGINIGLNKDTPHVQAAEEYLASFKILYPYGDYFVVNVSSPNTPGLRDLQQVGEIEKIFKALKLYRSDKLIYLKLAPELDDETRNSFYEDASKIGIDGFVLTNTLKGERDGMVGGWSGRPLTQISRDALAHAKSKTTLPVISVGGIMSTDEAVRRKQLGAELIQIYTAWIFRGPRFPQALKDAWFRP